MVSRYFGSCMVDPRGAPHAAGSHPTWAAENRHLLSGDVSEEDALEEFLQEGWTRVKPGGGVELRGPLDERKVRLVRAILRDLARHSPGRTLYVDDGDRSQYVRVDERGRPDLRALRAG